MDGRKHYIVLAITGLVLCLAGCALFTTRPKLAVDPGLLADDLGTGITIGMDASDARSNASASVASITVHVITREELASHSPYTERPGDGDLVLAIYRALPEDSLAGISPDGYETVEELRCYLAPQDRSSVAIMGHSLAPYTAEEIVSLLGAPLNRTESADGKVHLTYYFSLPGDKGRALKLVTSHDLAGCFAVLLALVEYPKKA